MSKYRKKPVEIEAFPVAEALRCAAHAGRWWDAWATALDNRRATRQEAA